MRDEHEGATSASSWRAAAGRSATAAAAACDVRLERIDVTYSTALERAEWVASPAAIRLEAAHPRDGCQPSAVVGLGGSSSQCGPSPPAGRKGSSARLTVYALSTLERTDGPRHLRPAGPGSLSIEIPPERIPDRLGRANDRCRLRVGRSLRPARRLQHHHLQLCPATSSGTRAPQARRRPRQGPAFPASPRAMSIAPRSCGAAPLGHGDAPDEHQLQRRGRSRWFCPTTTPQAARDRVTASPVDRARHGMARLAVIKTNSLVGTRNRGGGPGSVRARCRPRRLARQLSRELVSMGRGRSHRSRSITSPDHQPRWKWRRLGPLFLPLVGMAKEILELCSEHALNRRRRLRSRAGGGSHRPARDPQLDKAAAAIKPRRSTTRSTSVSLARLMAASSATRSHFSRRSRQHVPDVARCLLRTTTGAWTPRTRPSTCPSSRRVGQLERTLGDAIASRADEAQSVCSRPHTQPGAAVDHLRPETGRSRLAAPAASSAAPFSADASADVQLFWWPAQQPSGPRSPELRRGWRHIYRSVAFVSLYTAHGLPRSASSRLPSPRRCGRSPSEIRLLPPEGNRSSRRREGTSGWRLFGMPQKASRSAAGPVIWPEHPRCAAGTGARPPRPGRLRSAPPANGRSGRTRSRGSRRRRRGRFRRPAGVIGGLQVFPGAWRQPRLEGGLIMAGRP